MYRDDDAARTERANALINEIAELERQKVVQAATDRRLETVKLELRALQSTPTTPEMERASGRWRAGPERAPGLLAAHFCVFAATALATFIGYVLLM